MVVVTSGYNKAELEELDGLGCRVIDVGLPVSTSMSRNLGAESSIGDYLLFLDDDNTVAQDAIWRLWHSLSSWPDAAEVGPAMYYGSDRERIWCAGVSRTRLLMKTTFRQQLPPVLPDRLPSDDFPNCFMVRRTDFNAIGGFDAEHFPQHMEEADLARRLMGAAGGRVYTVASARVWHYIDKQLASRLHMRDPERAYFCARGRAVFTAIYGDRLQWATYVVVGQWLFTLLYLGATLSMSSDMRIGIFRGYIRGLFSGLADGWHIRGTMPFVRAGSSVHSSD